jgi:hypothetical protein
MNMEIPATKKEEEEWSIEKAEAGRQDLITNEKYQDYKGKILKENDVDALRALDEEMKNLKGVNLLGLIILERAIQEKIKKLESK